MVPALLVLPLKFLYEYPQKPICLVIFYLFLIFFYEYDK